MKLLKILKDSELSKEISQLVIDLDLDIKEFCIDLSLTMRYHNGIGISAPQVGVLKRIIVIDVVDPRLGKINYIMINPQIVEAYDSQRLTEGCLSFPKQYVETKRSATVKVKWLNTSGMEMEEVFYGLPAAVVQHEIDHLNGLTMFDRNE